MKPLFAFALLAITVLSLPVIANGQQTTGNIVVGPAPASVLQEGTVGPDAFLFVERSHFVLPAPLSVDLVGDGTVVGAGSGTLPAGTIVTSYFLHLDQLGTTASLQCDGTITFSRPILGVITSSANLDQSDSLLAATPTLYPTGLVPLRGFESGAGFHDDTATVTGSSVLVNMGMKTAVDQARILVQGCDPLLASAVIRAGSPPNPVAFTTPFSSGAVIGRSWDPIIDHTTFATGAVLDFVAVDTRGPINVPLAIGTLLCMPPPSSQIFFATPGMPFSIPVPNDCALVGQSVCAQGGSLSAGPTIRLANALDLVIGNS